MRLILPNHLSLEANYNATIDLIDRLSTHVLRDKLPVLLDFSAVRSVELAATLVLTSEIDRCRRLGGAWIVNGTYPKDRGVYDQFETMGFYKLLGIRSMFGEAPAASADPLLRVLPFVTGTDVNGETIIGFLDTLLDGVVGVQDHVRRDLYGCLIEAIKNATEHANKGPSQQKAIPKRWWMAGSARPGEGDCAIVVFDQGSGIPNTLSPTIVEGVRSLMARVSFQSADSMFIRAATRLGRTSTGQQGRGKGFGTMKKFVDRSSRGELTVYSLRGRYDYVSNGSGGGTGGRNDHATRLGGTLVQWRMQHTSDTHRAIS